MDEVKIINTEEKLKNIKCNCPNCGATEIYYDLKKGKLRCNYCKNVFEPYDLNNIKDVTKLEHKVIGSGAKDITSDEKLVTIKCANCGSEVVIDTSVAPHAKCHWCRSILSINDRIDNGTIPDAILPFSVSKEEAFEEMKKFISSRNKYALPKFKTDFNLDNVIGVYLPYLLVDAKLACSYDGKGEFVYQEYTMSKHDIRVDSEIYNVHRVFDLYIDDLSIESNKEILDKHSIRTNNIINSIMPFDTNNCVKFEANYLIGYSSEKRNINIDDVNKTVREEIKDIINVSMSDSIRNYNCGVDWDNESIKLEGSQWISAYLPVWLYTYVEEENNQKRIHYIAVNGRTKETMGSVPINERKLYKEFLISELVCIICSAVHYLIFDGLGFIIFIICMFLLTFYYDNKRKYYRNALAHHNYEYETRRCINYKVINDELFETRVGIDKLSSGKYQGRIFK